jgi:threonine dehydrogenase-like Zn-dependent dehydrogenase
VRQAITTGERTIEIVDRPGPDATVDGQALLGIVAVGLCGSDLGIFTGTDPYTRYPIRQGHEFSARILALPGGYAGPLSEGELVAVEPLLACGVCVACRRGRRNCCVDLEVLGAHVDGALCERLHVPVENLYPVGDVDPQLAAFVEPLSIGVHMVRRSGLREGDTAAVIGAGAIGKSVVLAARAAGARIAVVERVEARRRMALGLGAELALGPAPDAELAAQLEDWAGGAGPVVTFEATGVAEVARTAIAVTVHSGTVVLAGTPSREVSLSTLDIVRKELDVLGSRNNCGVFGDAVRLTLENADRVSRLISATFPLSETQTAVEYAIEHSDDVEKVMISIDEKG